MASWLNTQQKGLYFPSRYFYLVASDVALVLSGSWTLCDIYRVPTGEMISASPFHLVLYIQLVLIIVKYLFSCTYNCQLYTRNNIVYFSQNWSGICWWTPESLFQYSYSWSANGIALLATVFLSRNCLHGTWRFFTMVTEACCWNITRASSIPFTSSV